MGFIIIGPLLDDPKMAPWGTIFPMGIRDDGTAKWFQLHSIWVPRATFYLQTQKLFIENADFDYIGQDFNWPCTYSALGGLLFLHTLLYIARNTQEEIHKRNFSICVGYT